MTVSCIIGTTNGTIPLGAEIWLDDSCVFETKHLAQQHIVEFECNEDDGEHELKFVLKNKQPEHTQLSADGNIVDDTVIYVKDVVFEQVSIQKLITQLAVYEHDFNGTGVKTQEKFYGTLGCNGTVSLKFTTPSYIWILENI